MNKSKARIVRQTPEQSEVWLTVMQTLQNDWRFPFCLACSFVCLNKCI